MTIFRRLFKSQSGSVNINNKNFIAKLSAAVLVILIFVLVLALQSVNDHAEDMEALAELNPYVFNNLSESSISAVIEETTIQTVSYLFTPTESHKSSSSSDDDSSTKKKKTSQLTKKKAAKKGSKLIDFTAAHPYKITINRAENFLVIYGIDSDGEYTIPYKAYVCSTAKTPEDTPLGTFTIGQKYRWRLMVDGSYAQYAIRIYGSIMLHSIPYYEADESTLEYEEYNKLGTAASLGCIRMRIEAIQWIFENCSEGTEVEIYSEEGEISPIKLEKIKKLKETDEYYTYDPTDPLNPLNMEDETYR